MNSSGTHAAAAPSESAGPVENPSLATSCYRSIGLEGRHSLIAPGGETSFPDRC